MERRLPAHALIELVQGFTQGERIAFARIEILLPGGLPAAGAMCGAFVGSPRYERMRVIDPLSVTKAISRIGSPQRGYRIGKTS